MISGQALESNVESNEEAFAEGAVGVVITHGTDTLHLSAAAMAMVGLEMVEDRRAELP